MSMKHIFQIMILFLITSAGVGSSAIGTDESETSKPASANTPIQTSVLITTVPTPTPVPTSVPGLELIPNNSTLYKAGIQLARQGVNEAGMEDPYADMSGILQVAHNIQRHDENLLKTLQRLSPHVAGILPATDPHQLWTGSLPASGSEPGKFWIECPALKCSGNWRLYSDKWDAIRKYGIKLVRMVNPPTPVHGFPVTWGGKMDLYRASIERPNLCMLESSGTNNYFFGNRSNPKNKCISIPDDLLTRSKETYNQTRFIKVIPVSLAKGG